MESIKQEIISCIYENGENLITGPVLQEVLLDMVDDTNAKIASGSVPGDLVEKTGSWDDAADWVEDNSGSLVHDTDLDGYATERWVEDQGYLKEVPEGYATTESLNELSESVAELSSSIPSVDLSGYATTESVNEATQSVKDWVEAKHYLTTASLSGSVTEESVQFMINDSTASMKEWVENQNYATETYVSESIANLDIPDTSGFVTTQSYNQDSASFDERINSISGSDLSGYATTESLNLLSESVAEDLEGKADRSDLPDLTGYATEQWVQEQGYLTEHQDISGLATTESVNNLSESVANDFANLNIPDVSGLATTSSVNSLSESVATDITGLSESIAAITGSDLSGYVTTASYNQDSASFDQRINSMSGSEGNYLPLTGGALQDPESDWTKLEVYSPTGEGGFLELAAGDEGEASLDLAGASGNEVRISSEGNLEFSWNDEGDEGSALLELPKIDGEDTIAVRGDLTSLSESVAQDLEGKANAGDIPDVSIYATTQSLNSVSESLSASIAAISGSGVDLSGYVTTASYNTDSASFDQRIDAIVVPDLSEYATTSSVNSISESLSQSIAAITGSDLSGYATTESVNNLSSSVNNTFNQYATTQSVTQLSQSISQSISQITGSAPDLSGYATTSSVNALSESVATDFENLNIPDVGSYLSSVGLAEEDPIQGDWIYIEAATSESLASVSESLSASIAAITGSEVDLSGYATTASVNGLSSSVGDISSSFADTIANLPTGSSSGDYLPLTGGYVTGPTRFEKLGVGFDATNFSNGQARISKLGVGRNPSNVEGQLVISKNIQVGGNGNSFDSGDRCIAVGSSGTNTNNAHYSIAVGENCSTNIYGGFVAGRENVVTDNGAFGTATGFRCRTIAMAGYAGGCRSTASANFATAIGFGAEARSLGQVVLGSYNEYDPAGSRTSTGSYAVILGNGKSSTWNQDNPGDIVRSNGLAIKWDGGIDINYSGSTITLQDKIAELEQGGGSPIDLSGYATTESLNQVSESISQSIAELSNSLDSNNLWERGAGSGSIQSVWYSGSTANYANGDNSLAHGSGNQALGVNSHAEGANSVAIGAESHAEGVGSNRAIGYASHVEGGYNEASGNYSHAEGEGTKTTNRAEHAQGRYNVTRNDQIFSIGVGHADDSRKNAVSIITGSNPYPSASIFLYGLGGYDGTNPQRGTNDLVSVIESLEARIAALESQLNS